MTDEQKQPRMYTEDEVIKVANAMTHFGEARALYEWMIELEHWNEDFAKDWCRDSLKALREYKGNIPLPILEKILIEDPNAHPPISSRKSGDVHYAARALDITAILESETLDDVKD